MTVQPWNVRSLFLPLSLSLSHTHTHTLDHTQHLCVVIKTPSRCYRSTFCNILQRSRMTHIGLGKRLVTLLQLGLCLSMILSTDFELIMIMIRVDYDY